MGDTAFMTRYAGAPRNRRHPKMPKNWIAKATSKNKGAFSKKAKAAGYTTKEYAAKKAKAPGKLGKEARLAKTLMNLRGSLAD